jgi:hypothetical protein
MSINPKQLGAGNASFGQPLVLGNAGFFTGHSSQVPVGLLGTWFRPSVPAGNTLAPLPSDWRICDGSVCVDPNPTTPIVLTNATGFLVGDTLNFNSGAGAGTVYFISGTTMLALLTAGTIAPTGSVTDSTSVHTTTYTMSLLTIGAGSAGIVTNGLHNVIFTFEDVFGNQSPISPPAGITIAGSTTITITVPTDPSFNAVARNIWMTKTGGGTTYYFVARIADNTTSGPLTNFINVADASLTKQADGTAVTAGSGGGPWNGLALPNLGARFIRGHSTLTNATFGADVGYVTGGGNVPTGGTDSNNLIHGHDMNSHQHAIPNHTHDLGSHTHGPGSLGGPPPDHFHTSHGGTNTGSNEVFNGGGSLGLIGSVQSANNVTVTTGATSASVGNTGNPTSLPNTGAPNTASTQNALGATENRPVFTEMLQIIKIR